MPLRQSRIYIENTISLARDRTNNRRYLTSHLFSLPQDFTLPRRSLLPRGRTPQMTSSSISFTLSLALSLITTAIHKSLTVFRWGIKCLVSLYCSAFTFTFRCIMLIGGLWEDNSQVFIETNSHVHMIRFLSFVPLLI